MSLLRIFFLFLGVRLLAVFVSGLCRFVHGSGGGGFFRVRSHSGVYDGIDQRCRHQRRPLCLTLLCNLLQDLALLGTPFSSKLLAQLLQPGFQPRDQSLRIPPGGVDSASFMPQEIRPDLTELLQSFFGLDLRISLRQFFSQSLQRLDQGSALICADIPADRFLLHDVTPFLISSHNGELVYNGILQIRMITSCCRYSGNTAGRMSAQPRGIAAYTVRQSC